MKGNAKVRYQGPIEQSVALTFTDAERGWRLELTPDLEDWSVETLSVTRLEGGQPLTAASLREIASALPGLLSYLGRKAPTVGGPEAQEDAVAAAGERGELLVEVARVYSRAVALRDPRPVVAVCEEFVWSKAHANRLIREARDIGLLPPSGREKKDTKPRTQRGKGKSDA